MKTYTQTDISGKQVLHISLLPDDHMQTAMRIENAISKNLKNEEETNEENSGKSEKKQPKMSLFKKINRLALVGTLPALN